MPSNAGIQNPSLIDLVTVNNQAGDVRLIMIQMEPWDNSDRQIDQLQAKAETYVSFVEGGQLARTYPEVAGQPVTIQLDAQAEPTGRTADAIARLREALQKRGINFEVNRLP
jgi:hypothetical protein